MNEIISKYYDKVIIELSGHEQIGDIRFGTVKTAKGETVLGRSVIINPGMTAIDGQKPGVSLLDLDDITFEPHNLRQMFFDIEKTYDMELPMPSDISTYPFYIVDYKALF